ncbi:MAG: hypothetical protein HQL32_10830 [Planctomycetes bacterium]|nr:hypothetical protein [Planctomycetota bacterium]
MRNLSYLKVTNVLIVICHILILSGQASGKDNTRVADIHDGSLSGRIHHINLYNEKGEQIKPSSNYDQPYSPKQTCGHCHNVEEISSGWHFNHSKKNTGRRGEPWIYVDIPTATQIPLSLNHWPGTFQPADLGISDWNFIRQFGRHMTGGGLGSLSDNTISSKGDRWGPSGEYEIDCLSCHSSELIHDQSMAAEQTLRQNYRWSPTSTASFGYVEGSSARLKSSFKLGDNARRGPKVIYDENRFFADDKVFLKINRKVDNERCYYCHSTQAISEDPMDNHQDIHMSAGMSCSSCHSHGLDHKIHRGYEGEEAHSKSLNAARSSCKGCHSPDDTKGRPLAGQFNAPKALHKGIPPVHFDKLSCTACHSGPWPKPQTLMSKTSRSHAMGTHGGIPNNDRLPYIQHPVFLPGHDGKLTPHRLMWPAYWGTITGTKIMPLSPDKVKSIARNLLPRPNDLKGPSWPEIDLQKVQKVLHEIEGTLTIGSSAVYVGGGNIYRLEENQVLSEEHEAAQPYTWPLAHNVRPKQQSLGIHGCQDCHSEEAPLINGSTLVNGLLSSTNTQIPMAELSGIDDNYLNIFAFTFAFRPLFKAGIVATIALILLVIIWFLLRIMDGFIRGGFAKKDDVKNMNQLPSILRLVFSLKSLAHEVALISITLLASSGFGPLLFGQSMHGPILMIHMISILPFLLSISYLGITCAKEHDLTLHMSWTNICFWSTLILSIPLALTTLISMFPLVGTGDQIELLKWHSVFGILFVCFTIMNIGIYITRKLSQKSS